MDRFKQKWDISGLKIIKVLFLVLLLSYSLYALYLFIFNDPLDSEGISTKLIGSLTVVSLWFLLALNVVIPIVFTVKLKRKFSLSITGIVLRFALLTIVLFIGHALGWLIGSWYYSIFGPEYGQYGYEFEGLAESVIAGLVLAPIILSLFYKLLARRR